MTLKGSKTPLVYWKIAEPGMVLDNNALYKARHKAKVGNHCPVCGRLIQPKSHYCQDHARQRGGGRKAGSKSVNSTNYGSKIYLAPLSEPHLRANLSLPTALCSDWGTTKCLWCEYVIPTECPGLDGMRREWCGSCRVPCRCNGSEE